MPYSAAVKARALTICGLALAGLCAAATSVGADERATAAASPALQRVGEFDTPTYVTAPPGRHAPPVRDRARRHHQDRARRAEAEHARSSTSGHGCPPAARVGCCRWPSRPTTRAPGASTSTTSTGAGTSGSTSSGARPATPTRAQAGSRRNVIRQNHHNRNHKGGQLQFGPDGLLYAGLGDGGGRIAPQRPVAAHELGKLLRIDPRRTRTGAYRIPRSNPFRRRAGVRREIFSLRPAQPLPVLLRPPKGHMLDRRRGPGRAGGGRLRRTRRAGRAPRGGQNFGWSIFEGTRRLPPGPGPPALPPGLQRGHSAGVCSIIGGYVIRDRCLGGSTAATSTATSATQPAYHRLPPRPRARRQAAGPRVGSAAVLRRGRVGADLHASSDGGTRQPPGPALASRSRPSASPGAQGPRPPARPG